jgi:CubicO group peptidase (beta-lactamase class C family)
LILAARADFLEFEDMPRLFSLTAPAFALALLGCDPSGPGDGAVWPTRGWAVDAPGHQGFHAGFAAGVDAYVAEKLPALRGVVIVRHGRIVYERYAPSLTADSLNDIQSAGKSILSALVGIATVKYGEADLPEETLVGLVPEGSEPECRPQAERIKLGEVLAMTSGIPQVDYASWSSHKDRIRYALSQPLTHAPGEAFLYSDMGAHVVSGVVTALCGRSALDFADENLFAPLGITRREWPTDSSGLNTGDGEIHLTVRDMAKFGYLYLHGGEWEGRQVVPAAWVAKSTAPQSKGGDPEGTAYGWLWWVGSEGKHPCYLAAGYGGQTIEVIPDLDMVVAVASAIDSWHRETRGLIGEAVLPGLE